MTDCLTRESEKVTAFLATCAVIRDAQGRQMIVRNGHLPVRTIQTGIGAVPVRGSTDCLQGRSDSVYIQDPAPLSPAEPALGGVDSVALFARDLDR